MSVPINTRQASQTDQLVDEIAAKVESLELHEARQRRRQVFDEVLT